MTARGYTIRSAARHEAADRFRLQLTAAPDGSLRIAASGPGGAVEATSARSVGEVLAIAGGEPPASWASACRVGCLLYETVFPEAVRHLLEESRHDVGEAPLPIDLEIAVPDLAALPWELLREPEAGRFLAPSAATPLTRRLPEDPTRPAKSPRPSAGNLRVGLVAPAGDEATMAAALAVGADTRVDVALLPTQLSATSTPHVVQLLDGAPPAPAVPPGIPLVVRVGGIPQATSADTAAEVTIPLAMPVPARTTFLAALYAALAAGQPVDRAVAVGRVAVADAHTIVGLAWAQPVLTIRRSPAPLVVPSRRLVDVTQTVRKHTFGWLTDTLSGVVTSAAIFFLGLILFRLGFSSSPDFTLDIFSPLALYESFKGLVLELSTFQEYFLLALAGALGVPAVLATLAWHHRRRLDPDLPPHRGGHLTGSLTSLRTVSFLAVATLTVLGAYAYQQYLWRALLPIPQSALGIAITREAAAASFRDDLSEALFTQGQARRVVVRELPVRFDARDTQKARALGKRIGAKAVIIYRADERDADGATEYAAYVVFTDPTLGLTVNTAPAATGDQQPVIQVRQGVEVPVLRTRTLAELVAAAAGIIAFEEDHARDAIEHLELALPKDPDAPNTGIVSFYLGNAYELDDQIDRSAAAYERASAFYENRRDAGETLGPQDELILARTYLERGRIAAFADEWTAALDWYERAVALREDLLARAAGLERPSDVHATYGWLFTLMADAERFLGKREEQQFWTGRATAEIDALVEAANPDDPHAQRQVSVARFFLGDCVGALAALDKALALDPRDIDLRNDAAIIAWNQGRSDLAGAQWRQSILLDPNAGTARQLLAVVLVDRALNSGQFHETVYLDEAAALYRDILRLDPANLNAHEEIAELANLRGHAAEMDMTAVLTGDDVTLAKSLALWRTDPDRHRDALDAFSVAIEEHRILATELRAGNPTDQAALATAYTQRQYVVYATLTFPPADKNDPQLVTAGEKIVDDAAQVRTWTDVVLAPGSSASRLDRLNAWAARVESLNYEWGWAFFYQQDPVKAAALAQEYRQAVAEALIVAGAQPVPTIDEIPAVRTIYFGASFIARGFDQNETGAAAYDQAIAALTARESTERDQSTKHLSTFCAEEQERQTADELLTQGDVAGARTHYEAALTFNPRHVPSLIGLAETLYRQGDIQSAITQATAATAAAPNDPTVWSDLGLYNLAAGDGSVRDAAYAHLLEVIAALPPQERMAHLRAAVADLQTAIETKPDLTPSVLAVVQSFARALDGMAADLSGTYQYSQLYAALGVVALYGDDAVSAEQLLRTALALDPHQPVAAADLALAVIAQGRDATAEIAAAVAETNDPLWQQTSPVTPETLRAAMAAEGQRYVQRFPGRNQEVEPLIQAIAAASQSTKASP